MMGKEAPDILINFIDNFYFFVKFISRSSAPFTLKV